MLNFCELQALGSGNRPKYLCTCHGSTCCFCFVVHAGLFWPCQVPLQELLCLIPLPQMWQVLFGGCNHLNDFSPFLLMQGHLLLAVGQHLLRYLSHVDLWQEEHSVS